MPRLLPVELCRRQSVVGKVVAREKDTFLPKARERVEVGEVVDFLGKQPCLSRRTKNSRRVGSPNPQPRVWLLLSRV